MRVLHFAWNLEDFHFKVYDSRYLNPSSSPSIGSVCCALTGAPYGFARRHDSTRESTADLRRGQFHLHFSGVPSSSVYYRYVKSHEIPI